MGNLVVSGMGRCGSSVVMQMLAAGGFPVCGEFPDYEPFDALDEMGRAPDGHAYKMIWSPKRDRFPDNAEALIWLDRDPNHQSKSHFEFLRMNGHPIPNRTGRKKYLAEMKRQRKRAFAAMGNRLTLVLEFDHILKYPESAAAMMAGSCGAFSESPLDLSRMARQVRTRGPEPFRNRQLEILLKAGVGGLVP